MLDETEPRDLYVPSSAIRMANHPVVNERWLHERIAEDPSILGLGDIDLKDSERLQTHGGRLDLLLFDPESNTRFETELQLGATDPSHIVRCIEYWDAERRRYPQYEHVAVLVAEEITTRFFNVISLFNGAIPIIAIQAQLLQVGESFTLSFTKVLDVLTLATEEEDESEPADRSYWEGKSSRESMCVVEQVAELARECDEGVELNYNRHYIGLARHGRADNYIVFKPRKGDHAVVELRIAKRAEIDDLLDEAGLDRLAYMDRSGQYRIRLTESDLADQREALVTLIALARGGS